VQLEGDRVLLRTAGNEDLDALLRIRNEPEVARWWDKTDLDDLRNEFIDVPDHFVIELGGEVIGGLEFYEEEDPMYRHASVDLFITAARQGQGLGTESIRIIARYLFEEREHHRLTIDPAATNERAIRTYERVGFKPVGVMRDYERGPDGAWHDGLLMDLLRKDFRP
jgi:aminoglycoside 6'-N-acetyltransferase